jgi:hypothetical protein
VSPQAYVAEVARLVAAGLDQEALAYSAQFHAAVEPDLSLGELARVDGLLESAAMAVSLQQEATAASPSGEQVVSDADTGEQ